MLNTKTWTYIVMLTVCTLIIPVPAQSAAQPAEPITLYENNTGITTLDPQLSADSDSNAVIENIFVGLTNTHPETGLLQPELATSWAVSDDGLVWTFTLRSDVPWVRWNAATETGDILRMVTAHDAAYAIQRACDPRLGAYYGNMLANIVKGCDQLAFKSPETVLDEDYDLVQVRALDNVTLEITLNHAAGYFLSMTTMPIFHPVPPEVIAEYGATWTEPEHIVTSGPFMLDAYVHKQRVTLLRSPYLPQYMQGSGNLERVIILTDSDLMTDWETFLNGQFDIQVIPHANVGAVLNDPGTAPLARQQYTMDTFYFGFAHDKPPFDDVHVRRAFSAILNRAQFAGDVMPFVTVPITHITPPGIFGAPPIDEIGVGYDPDYAREQLALAGYPDCEGLPTVQIIVPNYGALLGDFLIASAEAELGCRPDQFHFEAVEVEVMFGLINADSPPENRPHVWLNGWGPDYPDANTFVGDLLGCNAANPYMRPCTPVDDLIYQAALETDLLARIELYEDIEERFFGPKGEFPVAPFLAYVEWYATQPWFSGPFVTDGLFGARHLDWYTIDQEAQLAARGG